METKCKSFLFILLLSLLLPLLFIVVFVAVRFLLMPFVAGACVRQTGEQQNKTEWRKKLSDTCVWNFQTIDGGLGEEGGRSEVVTD